MPNLLSNQAHPALADCWYLTGATASGKTRVGMALARMLDAEIVSLDSMAVYREMDIGTAKPSEDERRAVPHHLIDIRLPVEDFSLAEYVQAAADKTQEIQTRGKRVLFVGGTPLYLKALLRGVYEGPPADWEFRRQVEAELERVGMAALRERLWQVDPLSAAKLHENDKRRMIRALEVYKLTGRPISHLQTQFERNRPADQCRAFQLSWPRPLLHERINRRVDMMFDAGLVGEVRGLLDRHGSLSRTAAQAVGYREVIECLQSDGDVESTREVVKARTRQFARRQETWFRSLSECRRVEYSSDGAPDAIAASIVALGQTAS
ncbi:MAG: tRNA (adenosine(37)-N6)-dimethylallyltransferase MiaA [Pirellulaceae bacterium]|jgi:tRNA dimethylallyltransferase|nr:tRNA (adenosine(37)-N6)-dimethylallyltransferase MiaA [Pirellulaceae bacterium]